MEEIFQFLWYLVIGFSVIAYAVLDGFDLGVGCLHLFAKGDRQRRLMLNAIGPVWDGNEVWLVIVFGGMFVGFPAVYASICSAFYNLIMILLFGLMIRAVSIEFRSKQQAPRWRFFWDKMFAVASYIIAFLIGVILGNLIVGIPIDAQVEFLGSFWDTFTPYTILVGFMSIAVFAMHGAIYMLMKTEGEMHDRVRQWINPTILLFIILYSITTCVTLFFKGHMLDLMKKFPYLFGVGLLTLLAIVCVPFFVHRKKDGTAFIFSSLSIAFLIALFGLGTYPFMVRSSLNGGSEGLTLFNSAATLPTMKVVLLVALMGIPLVFVYGWWVYRIFRGKVVLDEASY